MQKGLDLLCAGAILSISTGHTAFDYDGDVAVSYEGAWGLAISVFDQACDAEPASGDFDASWLAECLENEWLAACEIETDSRPAIVFAD